MMSFFKNFGCSANLNESSFIIHLYGDSVDSDLLVDNLFKLILMHHMNNFYQVLILLIIFCLLQNVLDFSCSPLDYDINILGIFSIALSCEDMCFLTL